MSCSKLERIEKPWGHEILFAVTEKYMGKILFIKKGHRLSLQYHKQKDETLYCLKGRARLIIKNDNMTSILPLAPDCSYHVEPMTIHRLEAIEDTTLAEVSTPEAEDVVRVEDDYGRASGNQ
jgi:mannose-6-phosphate isomerase-like protein (cupin superfamily)